MREYKAEKSKAVFGAGAVELVMKGDRRLTGVTNSTAINLSITGNVLPISKRNMNWEDD